MSRRRRHTPDQIIRKLAEGQKLLAGGAELDYTAGVALCALGSYEPAAVLFGKSATMEEQRWGLDWILEMLAATDAALREALGEQQVATLAAQGAALDLTDAVAHLHAEADRTLGAP